MKKTAYKLALLIALALGAGSAKAQTYAVAPIISSQIFGTDGLPLNGGFIYTCAAGSICPGTPQATWTSSSGATQLPNPIIIGVSGFSQCGSPGTVCSPFINTALFYKFVIANSANVVLYVFDGVSASGGGGGGSTTNYWTLSGSTISNNNAAGAGNVQTGSDLIVGGKVSINGAGGVRMLSPATSNYASFVAGSGMGASVSWALPLSDSSGVQCISSNGAGQLSFVACGGGGGGGGSPGGGLYSLQSSNPAGTFYGDGNLTYTPATSPPQLTLVGVVQLNGLTAGLDVPASTAYNGIQIPQGGVLMTQLTWEEEGATPTVGAGFAAMVYSPDPAPHTANVNVKLGDVASGAFWPVAMSDVWAAFTTGDCVQVTVASGIPYFTDAGGACTTGGGGGTVTGAAQYAVPYYSASGTGTTIAGNASILTFNPTLSPPTISLAGTMVTTTTTGGFNAGSCTLTNCVQTPVGGMTAKFLITTDSLFMVQESAPALSGSGQVRIYADNLSSPTTTGGAGLHVSVNAGAYLNIATTAGTLTSGHCTAINAFGNFIDSGGACGGGGGGPVGADTQVPYNKAGVEFADANFLWLYGSQKMQITGLSANSGLDVLGGAFINATGGFTTSSSSATAIQAANGQITSKTMFVTDSYFWQTEGTPALSGGSQARMYADSGSNTLRYSINGGAYQTLSTGGVSSINGLTGTPSVVGTANEVIVSAGGSSITLSTPQAIGTSNTVTFANVNTSNAVSAVGVVSSQAGVNVTTTAASNSIQTTGGVQSFIGLNVTQTIAGLGQRNSIQSTGEVNACNAGACASNSAFAVAGSTVINSSGQFIGPGVNAAASGIGGAGFNITTTGGGFVAFGQTKTFNFTVPGGGTCSVGVIGGIITSFTGSCP